MCVTRASLKPQTTWGELDGVAGSCRRAMAELEAANAICNMRVVAWRGVAIHGRGRIGHVAHSLPHFKLQYVPSHGMQ